MKRAAIIGALLLATPGHTQTSGRDGCSGDLYRDAGGECRVAQTSINPLRLGAAEPNGLAVFGAGSATTTANTASVGARADGADANIAVFLEPRGSGAVRFSEPTGLPFGGNLPGTNSLDLQHPNTRTASQRAATGDRAVGVGHNNEVSQTSGVGIGTSNRVLTGGSGTVAFGQDNESRGFSNIMLGRGGNDAGRQSCLFYSSRDVYTLGSPQTVECILARVITSTASTRLTTNGATPDNTNSFTLRAAYALRLNCTATVRLSTGEVATYTATPALFTRPSTASTSALVGGGVWSLDQGNLPGGTVLTWTLAADTALGAVSASVSGAPAGARVAMSCKGVEVGG